MQQVDDICWSAQAEWALGLATDDDTLASGGSDEFLDILHKVDTTARISGEVLRIANLKADTALQSGITCLLPKVKGEMLGQVERDDGDIESVAGIVKGLGCQGPHGDEVVSGSEGRETVVGGGRVGEGERCATKHVRKLWR